MEGIRGVAPVAALLAFAVIYFGVMNDAGLFEPLIRALLRVVARDPVRIALGTAAIATVAHLDGAGASTFMVTVPAMLPLYKRAGMSPLALTCITALAAGTMNMLPWGGPTTRAAAALQVGHDRPVRAGDPADDRRAWLPSSCSRRISAVASARGSRRGAACSRARLGPRDSRRSSAGRRHAAAPAAVVLQRGADGRHARGARSPSSCRWPSSSWSRRRWRWSSTIPDAHEQRERLTAHGAAAMMMVTTRLRGRRLHRHPDEVRDARRDVDGSRPRPAGRRAAAPAGRRRHRVDAAEPGLRSRLVLLRPAAGAGAGVARPRAARRSRSGAPPCSGR